MGSLSDKLSGTLSAPPTSPRGQWYVVDSELLKESILCVTDPAHLPEAKIHHPKLVAYLLREVETLYAHRGNADVLKAVHRIKQKFGGHVRSEESA